MKKLFILFLVILNLSFIPETLTWLNRSYCGWSRNCGFNNAYNYNSMCCGWANRSGYHRRGCGINYNCGYTPGCYYRANNCYNASYCRQQPFISRVVENPPCGLPPCCLKTIQVPANSVQHINYSWQCPTDCQTNVDYCGLQSTYQVHSPMPQINIPQTNLLTDQPSPMPTQTIQNSVPVQPIAPPVQGL